MGLAMIVDATILEEEELDLFDLFDLVDAVGEVVEVVEIVGGMLDVTVFEGTFIAPIAGKVRFKMDEFIVS
jgi:hypothetical protein